MDRWLKILLIAAVLLVGLYGPDSQADERPSEQSEGAANTDPFAHFKATLRRDGELYLLNGTWLNERDLRDVWTVGREGKAQSSGPRGSERDSVAAAFAPIVNPDISLNVNLVEGRLDYWANPTDRHLTYAIDKTSMFEDEFLKVQKAIEEAANDWVAACPQCGISFTHLSEFDAAPDHNRVTFIVRKDDQLQAIVSSFFPSDAAARRYITVSSEFFSPKVKSPAGAMRHSLGNVLGYRHEHITAEAGCWEEDKAFITGSYDPKSVMHYRCGKGGTEDMELSPRDILSHQIVYGQATIQIQIEGDNLLTKAAHVMRIVAERYPRLQRRPYNVFDPEICRSYITDLGLRTVVEDHEPDSMDCVAFLSLSRTAADSRPELPVVFFNRFIEVANGSVLNENPKARTEYNNLVARADPHGLNTKVTKDGDIGFSYVINWPRYRANIPVSEAEINGGLVQTLWKETEGVRISIDSSVASSLAAKVRPYSVEFRNPATDMDSMCVPANNFAGSYAQFIGQNFDPDQDFDNVASGAPVLKCDFPEPSYCKACSADSCGGHPCRFCTVCNKTSNAAAIVVDDSFYPEALKRTQTPNPGASCKWDDYGKDHHGTLMAQIVAGRNKFIGFVPQITPKLLKNDAQSVNFDTRARELATENDSAVAVVPTQLCHSKQNLSAFVALADVDLCNIRGELKSESQDPIDSRRAVLVGHSPSSKIQDMKNWLWVAAIGQPDGVENNSEPDVSTYSETSIASPIALAEAENVVVVSACDQNCDISRDVANKKRQVWPRANRGSGNYRPHVIAPGGIGNVVFKDNKYIGGMPGYGKDGKLVKAYGTSQSAAFVAGLASRMLSCYPLHYQYKNRLKEALQFTSMPVRPVDATAPDLVATGLVDVKMALRNPGFIYLLQPGAGDELKRVETSSAQWCSGKISAKNYRGETVTLETGKIRRLVRLYTPPATRFIAYTFVSAGKIERSDPLIDALEPDAPILAINAEKLKLQDLKDVVIFNELGFSADACKP